MKDFVNPQKKRLAADLVRWYIACVKVIPFLQTFLTLILISFLIMGLDLIHFLAWPKIGLSYLTTPVQYGFFESSKVLSKQLSFLTAARFAAKENEALKQQMASLLSENANLRTKLAETQSQLEQQKALDSRTYKLLAARPIGLDRYLKIDRGSKDGIKVNQAVVFKDSFLGQVTQVSEKVSNIRLVPDPDSKIAAFSLSRDGKAKGVLLGQFGSEMLLDKILHEEAISIGDLVYSEGTEGYLPRGLILGRVSQVINVDNQVFKTAKVKPVFDVRDLELVYVILE